MSWRHQGSTGSNNIPLGKTRRFQGGDGPPDQHGHHGHDAHSMDHSVKRGRSPVRDAAPDGPRQRKKRNRWGDATDNKAAGLMGLPTAIMANMTSEQLEAYTLHLRIQEISQKLKIDDVVPADGDRSPSPPPQYDNFGRRVNTREYRYRKRLEDERHKLIDKAIKVIPNYQPPQDYRRPTKTQEKVYVPVNDYPEINFIGLLIGPRGNTLKKMESESGAKIAIRGKGSVKEGKGRSDAAHTSNQEEDLHCLIMADTEDKVNKAKQLIHNVIETAASIPEGQNELKRHQLRELATLNGTLRDDENQACQNCGQIGHRKYDCPEQRNYTANIVCRQCGNTGHIARDCNERAKGSDWRNGPPGPAAGRVGQGDAMDREMAAFMEELGEGPSSANAPRRIEAGPGGYNQGPSDNDAKPWQRGPTGASAPWGNRGGREGGYDARDHAPTGPSGGGGSAPWARRDGGQNNQDYYGGHHGGHGGYDAAQSNAGAPWQRGHGEDGGGHQGGGYNMYAPGYGGYGQAMGAPPGLGGAPGAPPGAPPGLSNMGAQYGGSPPPPPPSNGAPPPPPPGSAPPPPPPSDRPPPPPPRA